MSRTAVKRRLLITLFAVSFLGFAALGIWQVERLAWKRDLIARVDQRIHAAPVKPPARSTWASFRPEQWEYRRVWASGTFRHDRETLVDALTDLGPGYWVVTPLQGSDGTILVNRGFVPRDKASAQTRIAGQPAGRVTVEGLVRTSEPEGRVLRPNAPAEDRWYSRDVTAIAAAKGLGSVAPFFIDAGPNPAGYPIGGLTVVRFRNAHLEYAVTWFALALLCLFGLAKLRKPKA